MATVSEEERYRREIALNRAIDLRVRGDMVNASDVVKDAEIFYKFLNSGSV